MSKVHTVFVQIKAPRGASPGKVAEGCYTVIDRVVTLTDRQGNPASDIDGNKYSHELAEGETAKVVACRLTRELRTALRGKDAQVSDFDGPIEYPKTGWR
jgi:hypothetical protein